MILNTSYIIRHISYNFEDIYNYCYGTAEYHFYVKDHLGNIRAVVNQNDSIEEINHYYPYGTLFGESTGLANSVQPYKYSGKELDRMHGLDMFDHGARWSDPMLGRWGQVDNRAEDYYPYTPYEYCLFNPINNIDPDGNSVWTKLGKTIIKVGKAVAKNGVKALANTTTYVSAVDGVIGDIQTLASSETTVAEKVVAGVSIASEALPVSVSDIKEIKSFIKKSNYSALPNPKNFGPGKKTTRAQKKENIRGQ